MPAPGGGILFPTGSTSKGQSKTPTVSDTDSRKIFYKKALDLLSSKSLNDTPLASTYAGANSVRLTNRNYLHTKIARCLLGMKDYTGAEEQVSPTNVPPTTSAQKSPPKTSRLYQQAAPVQSIPGPGSIVSIPDGSHLTVD